MIGVLLTGCSVRRPAPASSAKSVPAAVPRCLIEQRLEGMPEEQLNRVMLAERNLLGALGREVFCRMNGLFQFRAKCFDYHARLTVDVVGLPR
ncbi:MULTISPECIES: hypothetical protein [unclassified Nocardia]|uniref:hypothetical protein n=1 Tax=Nocardia sp. NPDC051900 TaxID=3364326 RepID=UPI0037A96CD2